MNIDAYSFGSMTVDGKVHNADLIIFPDKIQGHWWRKEGHSLAIDDLKDVIAYQPDVLVIGRGHLGCMNVPSETRQNLQTHHIEVLDQKTGEAQKVFNEQVKKGRKVIGAFHLTC